MNDTSLKQKEIKINDDNENNMTKTDNLQDTNPKPKKKKMLMRKMTVRKPEDKDESSV